MANIHDFVDNPQVLSYARALDPEVFFGLTLFPVKQVQEIDYEYIKGESGSRASIIADVVPWESAAPLAPHEGIQKVSGELPPIKQKSRFNEKDVVKIFNPRTSAERQAVLTKLFDDVRQRVDGIYSRLNLIIMESLAYGSVTFTSEGIKLAVDWGFDDDHINDDLTGTTFWSDLDDSTPLTDIQNMQATIKSDTGYTCDSAVCSQTVVNYLLQNESIKQAMFGTGETSRLVTFEMLNQFLVGHGLPRIFVYDEQYKVVGSDRSLSNARYYPETRFTMWPSSAQLGETLMGPTAEGIRSIGAEEAPGIWASVYETEDPVNVWTYACAVAFPSFPGSDTVGILVVASEA